MPRNCLRQVREIESEKNERKQNQRQLRLRSFIIFFLSFTQKWKRSLPSLLLLLLHLPQHPPPERPRRRGPVDAVKALRRRVRDGPGRGAPGERGRRSHRDEAARDLILICFICNSMRLGARERKKRKRRRGAKRRGAEREGRKKVVVASKTRTLFLRPADGRRHASAAHIRWGQNKGIPLPKRPIILPRLANAHICTLRH